VVTVPSVPRRNSPSPARRRWARSARCDRPVRHLRPARRSRRRPGRQAAGRPAAAATERGRSAASARRSPARR
jgi:hypothetical protein